MCAKFGTIMMVNNDLAKGGVTYETPYTIHTPISMYNVFAVSEACGLSQQ